MANRPGQRERQRWGRQRAALEAEVEALRGALTGRQRARTPPTEQRPRRRPRSEDPADAQPRQRRGTCSCRRCTARAQALDAEGAAALGNPYREDPAGDRARGAAVALGNPDRDDPAWGRDALGNPAREDPAWRDEALGNPDWADPAEPPTYAASVLGSLASPGTGAGASPAAGAVHTGGMSFHLSHLSCSGGTINITLPVNPRSNPVSVAVPALPGRPPAPSRSTPAARPPGVLPDDARYAAVWRG